MASKRHRKRCRGPHVLKTAPTSGASRDTHPGEQVVRREVLERVEAAAELVHVKTVEKFRRLPQAQVAGAEALGRDAEVVRLR